MKKKIALMLTLLTMFASNVHGAEFNTTTDESDNVTVSGISLPDKAVAMRVLFLGNKDEPVEVTRDMIKENPGIFNYVDQTYVKSDGNYTFNFQIDGASGYYMIHLMDEQKDLGYHIVYHYNDEDVKTAIKELFNVIKNKSDSDIINYLDEYYLPCRISKAEYDNIKSKGYLPYLIKVIKKADSMQSPEELKSYINQAMFLKDFYSLGTEKNKDEFIRNNALILGLTEDENYNELYDKIYTDEEIYKIISDFSKIEYSDVKSFSEKLSEEILLGGFKYTKWTTVQKIIELKSDLLNKSDFKKYKDLYDKKSTKATDIIKSLTGNTYDSFAKVSEAFSDAVDNAESSKKTNSSSGGGGSSGGGSSSAGGTQLNLSQIKIPENKTENESLKDVPVPEGDKNIFSDLDSVAWAKDSIERLAEKGIVSGYGNGIFSPETYVTRESFLSMIIRGLNIECINNSVVFEDVDTSKWYSPFVVTAYNSKIIYGISDNIFGIGMNITRQDMAVIAVRAAEFADKKLISTETKPEFTDSDSISDYAKDAVYKLYNAGILNGKGNGMFKPKDICTRAEAAVIIDRLLLSPDDLEVK